MDLKSYFEQHEGIGILATCDPNTTVDMAVYAKPMVINQTTIAFVMRERLSHQNIREHLNAAYMFIKKTREYKTCSDYKGIRLYLTLQREEINQSVIEEMRKKDPCIYSEGDDSEKYLVFFTVTRIRPLVGDGPV
ncbi:MAG: pyridoxamine 5'-phosphate oxidase family protein [Planctomycetes bacterium]|nr:pyridoxamine 5'-phosphate oxidase family protein [Planctomycetota bacterium]